MDRKDGKPKIYRENLVIVRGEVAFVYSTSLAFSLLDAEDAHLISNRRWCTDTNRYWVAKINNKQVRLHRLVMNCKDDEFIDHINGDRSDNRKLNLRVCTVAENCMNKGHQKNNTSGYKGGSKYETKTGPRWRACCKSNENHIKLNGFLTAEQAAAAYNNLAIKLHGKFARLNEVVCG
jgi:hypothetical protein